MVVELPGAHVTRLQLQAKLQQPKLELGPNTPVAGCMAETAVDPDAGARIEVCPNPWL